MKKLASTLLASFVFVTFSITSQARSIDTTPVVAMVSGFLEGLHGAYLLADGRLQLEDLNGKIKTVQVTPQVLKQLTEIGTALEGVKLKESTTMVICRMMPTPSLGKLQVGPAQTLVLTNQDCTVGHKVQPQKLEDRALARELRTALTSLALNSL